jgi:diguanylate cyclase (GGDEF)-like protein
VDDDPTTLLSVSNALTRFGYEVETAADGLSAWNKLLGTETPVVVTDLEMPVEDGLSLCRRIRSAAFFHYTYIVLLTHRSDRKNLLEALAAGADDFVGKPLDPDQLRARLIVAQRIVTLEQELRQLNRQLMERNQGLKTLSRVDALTGAGNRAAFQEQIELAHANAVRGRRPYGIVVCDLDRFKQVNDVHGHQTGDRVLTAAVTAIRDVVRRGDLIFRYGGDEIVVIVPDEDAENVAKLAERICANLRNTSVETEVGGSIRLTASIGGAIYPDTCGEGSHWADLFGFADEAMYEVKRRGGDGVELAVREDEDDLEAESHADRDAGSSAELTTA